MRLFIALELPLEIKDYLFEIENELKNLKAGKINWVFKKNLHITLKFLGEVKENKVKDVIETLKTIKCKKFYVSLEDIGFYMNKLSINVIRVGFKPQEDIIKLQKLIDLETLGFGDIKLGGHVTLGRIKVVKDKKSFVELFNKIKIKNLGFQINSFSLFNSILKKDGPNYEVLETYDLL